MEGKTMNKIMSSLIMGGLILLVLGLASTAFAAGVTAICASDAHNGNPPNGRNGDNFIYDSTGATKLPTGKFVQLIKSTDTNIEPPNFNTAGSYGAPTGNDSIVNSGTIGNAAGFGAGEVSLGGSVTNGMYVYFRAWDTWDGNANTKPTGHYGDSVISAAVSGFAFYYTPDTFSTTKTEPVADTTPPAAISNLSASTGANAGEVNITWTAVGDDNNTGTATSYILKYSTSSITAANFDAATTYSQNWTPLAAGVAESKVLIGLTPGATLYFSIKARDEVPNTGAFGNSVSAVVQTGGLPSLVSATPASGNQGETLTSVVIVGSNTNFTAASTVDFGSNIVHGAVTRNSATQLTVANVVIASTATTGLRTVTVITGGETATGQIFTVNNGNPTSVVIDDYEGVAGNSSDKCSSYYVFGPTAGDNPTATRVTIDKHEGIYAMNTTYTAIADANNAWRGWGGVLRNTLDLSSYDTVIFWLKGDGSANKVKIQFKDADGSNYALGDADAISLSNISWTEYQIPKTKISNMVAAGTTPGLDWANIIEYQFVFSGTSASTGVLIDYVTASTGGGGGVTPHITGITPTTGAERTIVTITGSNFQASGGTINFAGGGVTTSVRSTDTGSLITSWADGQVVLSLPRMAAGTKTISLVRTDGVNSDNSITFEVTAATNEGSTSYNYRNPFNPLGGETTNIVFSPGSAGNVSVYIFDMTARQIAKLDWTLSAPSASVEWNGKNNYGEIVGDGVYLYRIVDAGSGKLISKGKILVINK